METPKFTREEIALSILNGIIGSMSVGSGSGALSEFDDEYMSGKKARREVCALAFEIADFFIQERDKRA